MPVHLTVDPDRPGKQTGFFHIPLSLHEDAWGVLRIPIAVIGHGRGPTVILEGGNHGDEYEGPIVLGELIRTLDPGAVSGRLICIPAINLPAVEAGCRTSPIDGLNMNRSFPGDALGSSTRQITAFVNDVLFPMADAFVDLHSGGSSLDIIPSAVIEPVADAAQHQRNVAAALAFGAPMTIVIDNRGDPRTATAAAGAAGLIVVGSEMGGGGTVSIDGLGICRRGVRNVLAHLGVLAPEMAEPLAGARPIYRIPRAGGHVLASEHGVFEPFHANGAAVRAGQPAGRIHCLADPARAPAELAYEADGIVFARRQPGRVRPGNCCLVVAQMIEGGP